MRQRSVEDDGWSRRAARRKSVVKPVGAANTLSPKWWPNAQNGLACWAPTRRCSVPDRARKDRVTRGTPSGGVGTASLPIEGATDERAVLHVARGDCSALSPSWAAGTSGEGQPRRAAGDRVSAG